MILAQVREHECVEADAVEPAQRRTVGARLDGGAPIAHVDHLAKDPLQVDRLGSRERRGTALAANLPLHGSDETRLAAGGLEDPAQQERRGRLPVRPGDSGELELLRRLAEERVGRDGHRLTGRRNEELRHVDVEHPLDDERDRAALDRLPREVVPVDALATDAEEERAGGHAPGVVGEIADRDWPARNHLARRERRDKGVEIHAERLEKPREAATGSSPQSWARPAGPRGTAG